MMAAINSSRNIHMKLLGKIIFSNPTLGLLLTLLILVASLSGCPPLLRLDQHIFDRLIQLRKPATNDAVTMVAIDLKSRRQLGDTPWSRRQLTRLIETIEQHKPAAIGLTFPLSFPSNDPAADDALADRAGNLVLTLEDHQGISPSDSRFFSANSLPQLKQIPTARELLLSLRNPLLPYLAQSAAPLLLPPMPTLRSRVEAGHLLLNSDSDNRLRRLPLLSAWQDRLIPALPLQLLLEARGEQLRNIGYGPLEFPGSLSIGNLRLNLGRSYQLLLDRSGRDSNLQRISASDLLQQKVPQNSLRNRIVLIGETTHRDNQQDLNPLEAASLATLSLINGTPLHQPAWGWLLETAILLYFAFICFLLLPRLSTRSGFLALLFFLLCWLSAAATSLILSGVWLHVAPVILLSLLGFLLVQFKRLRRSLSSSAAESNKMLGLTFQEQGLLDLALERFLRCPPDYSGMKEILYNLGLDFERKRMPQKALAVYQHLRKAGRFRDLKQRISQLKEMEQTTIIGATDSTMVINKAGEKPILGRYRVEKVLGQGAMGTVYLGVDPKINRQVAIKTLAYAQIEAPELADVKARFFREAEAAGRLSHPHIVTVYDVGEESDLAYMAMELLEGSDLSQYCNKKRLKPLQVLEIGAQIAGALEYAHTMGVVHRDIKPANIMLDKNGQVKVADFGVARVISSSRTETGVVLGTPSYMSPEQIAGKKVDGRSDLFSLGVVLYELLSGEKPFVADSLAALMYNISNAKYRPLEEVSPGLPRGCYQIVDKLLSKALSRRHKSADLLQRDLFDLLESMEGR
jgi:serine/threonine-protein kinase